MILEARSSRAHALLTLGLAVATLVAYWPALGAGFVWDDESHIVENPHLDSLAGLVQIWSDPRAIPSRQNYPLTFTTFWLEHQLWGASPFGYHLVNLLLHIACALLLRSLLAGLGVPFPWLAAFVFALHPVEVESVAWVSERKNTLSTLFYLLSMSTFLAARRAFEWRSILSFGLFVCALLSKTVTCSLPVALLIVRWWQTGHVRLSTIARTLPYFAVGLALALGTGTIEREHVGAAGPDWDFSLVERIGIAGQAWWFYIAKVLFPFGNSFFYRRFDPTAVHGPLLAAAALLGLAALWQLRARLGRGPLAALGFYSVSVLPALGFVDVYPFLFSFVADHFQYLASLGTIVLASAGLGMGTRRSLGSGLAAQGSVGVVLAGLAILTHLHARSFESPESLWRHTVATNPDAWIAHGNLGSIHVRAGRLDDALAAYDRALALKADIPEVQLNKGLVLLDIGRPAQAQASLNAFLERFPTHFAGKIAFARACSALGQHERASENFSDAIRIASKMTPQPDLAPAYQGLGEARLDLGDAAAALPALRMAVQLSPGRAPPLASLGRALAMAGQPDRARQRLLDALAIREDMPVVHRRLGNLYGLLGQPQEGITHLKRAIELRPGDAVAIEMLAAFYLKLEDEAAAIETYRALLRVDPSRAQQVPAQIRSRVTTGS